MVEETGDRDDRSGDHGEPGGGASAFEPRPYRAPAWLRSGHAQTVAGKLLRPTPAVPVRRERIDTPDGDFVDIDRVETDNRGPLLLVLHGLEGSTDRNYMRLTFHAALDRGLRPVGLNFRGCSGEPNRLARAYHSGDTDDLRLVLDHVITGSDPAGAVGFSLGGNVLLKYLGEEGDAARVDAGVAISVPFDLAAGVAAIGQGFMGRLYTRYFMTNLLRKIRLKRDLAAGHLDMERALAARNLMEYDDAVTAPIHGFDDAADYYRRSSAGQYIAGIRVPTLLLHSRDDPFLPEARIPVREAAENPHVALALTDRGGHVGFVYGTPWAPRFWAEEEAARFVGEVLTRGTSTA